VGSEKTRWVRDGEKAERKRTSSGIVRELLARCRLVSNGIQLRVFLRKKEIKNESISAFLVRELNAKLDLDSLNAAYASNATAKSSFSSIANVCMIWFRASVLRSPDLGSWRRAGRFETRV